MLRSLSVCAVLLALAPASLAQQKPDPKEIVIEMKVSPAPEASPALKYQLLPALEEMNPGNPILGYLKSFAEQNNFFHRKDVVEQRFKWLDMPLKDLPVKELRDYGKGALTQADYAARLTTPDWQILMQLKRDGFNTLLPEVQQLRSLATALKVRFRGEVADHRFDDALVTAKTMFALARHLGEHPSLIGCLVGLAVASATVDPLEEMVQQPGSPNLFWALAQLPQPLIDSRNGVQGEKLLWRLTFEVLTDKRPMTKDELAKAVDKGQEVLEMFTFQSKKVPKLAVQGWLALQAADPDRVKAAAKRLSASGLPEKTVNTFTPAQLILLEEKLALESALDDTYKAMQLPYWQARPLLSDAKKKTSMLMDLLRQFGNPFGGAKVLEAQVRVQQRLALLSNIEALRLHAATNQGQLPKKLSDLKLPLPPDPITGEPFQYSVAGATATLNGGTPPATDKNRKYVITMAAK